MRIRAILNRDGGALKTTDLNAFADRLRLALTDAGHEIDIVITPGRDLMETLRAAAADDGVDVIVAGGGDGTVSAAAGIVWRAHKVLGILPAGTFNLFARSLGLPTDLRAAPEALARTEIQHCDIASANGRAFIHQFSVGLQPSIVGEREKVAHRSRLGKIGAGIGAAIRTLQRPPVFRVHLALDGQNLGDMAICGMIAVSNNLYGDGHLPFADKLDSGQLGLYRTRPLRAHDNLRLAADLIAGTWTRNPNIDVKAGREVTISFPKLKRSSLASIDGELIRLEANTTIKIHPGALRVLVPAGVEKVAK